MGGGGWKLQRWAQAGAHWLAGKAGVQVLSPASPSVVGIPEPAFVGLIFSLGILVASE